MDKKKTKTNEELRKEEVPKNTELKEEIKKEQGSRKKLWWILGAVFGVIVLTGSSYAVWQSYSANKALNKEDKVQNAPASNPESVSTKTVSVSADGGLNLRKEASSSSELIIIIPNGTKLNVTEEKSGWYKVGYSGQLGWVSKEYTAENN